MAVIACGVAYGQPAWTPGTAYKVNDRVTFGELTYEARQAHTSQVGWEPPSTPALWQRPSPPAGTLSRWSDNTVYPLNTRVTFQSILYEARQAHTSVVGWEPPNVPALWQRPADDGVVSEWVPQKVYHARSYAVFEGTLYQALADHLSFISWPPRLTPVLWRFIGLSCTGRPDGGFCLTHYKQDGFINVSGFLPSAACRAEQCVRTGVPETIYRYPWARTDGPTITLSSADGTELRQALAQAESQAPQLVTIVLPPGNYDLDAALVFSRGNVTLYGDPAHPELVKIHPGEGVMDRVLFVNGPSQGGPQAGPLVALNGVTIEGGRTNDTAQGAGIAAQNAALIVQNSVVRDNITDAGGGGIFFNTGFLLVDRSLIEANGRSSLEGCGGGAFTRAGGILVGNSEEAYILNSTIKNNLQCRGSGVLSIASQTYLSQNTIAKNEAASWGAGLSAAGIGGLFLHFNTITENLAGRVQNGEDMTGGGLALRDFGPSLSMIGNIIANNRTLNEKPDDFAITRSNLIVRRSWRNDIQSWTIAQSPTDLGMDATLIGLNPMLGPLSFNGFSFGLPDLPTYAPALSSPIYRAYSPQTNAPATNVAPLDQRGYVRASLTTTTPGAVDPDASRTFPPPVYLEAEGGLVQPPLRVNADAQASGGSYVQVVPGTPTRNNPPPAGATAGIVTLRFNVAETGQYTIWGRVITPTTNDDSFWVSVDGAPWILWNNIPTGANWHWDEIHDTNNGGQTSSFLLGESNEHTLRISYREDGARLDRLAITEDPAFVPTGLGQ